MIRCEVLSDFSTSETLWGYRVAPSPELSFVRKIRRPTNSAIAKLQQNHIATVFVSQPGKYPFVECRAKYIKNAIYGIVSPKTSNSSFIAGFIVGFSRRLRSGSRSRELSCFLRQHFANALDLRAYAAEFFFDALVAAVDVIDAVDDGLAISN